MLLNQAFEQRPDFVIVALAGNSLNNAITNAEIYVQCRQFYQLLRNGLPETKIIATQAELRFYNDTNKWNAPGAEEYMKRRTVIINFLRRMKTKDAIMMVAGKNRIDHEIHYRDGVYLNRTGVVKYFDFVKCTIAYQYRKHFKS